MSIRQAFIQYVGPVDNSKLVIKIPPYPDRDISAIKFGKMVFKKSVVDVDEIKSVIEQMEAHMSGVEGIEDSPVAQWTRELKEAIKKEKN